MEMPFTVDSGSGSSLL